MFQVRKMYSSSFQLTRLLRGATDCMSHKTNRVIISTHTPLARRDSKFRRTTAALKSFQLTRLLRGATRLTRLCTQMKIISTHTPLARRDYGRNTLGVWLKYFNSHASCEARHMQTSLFSRQNHFNSHASCEARR